ncbi:743_t:CDS:2, partial [Racocetra persica]
WVSEKIKDHKLENKLFAACEQYMFELDFNFLNKSKETTKSVTKETTKFVNILPTYYGSDSGILSPNNAYLNLELIVVRDIVYSKISSTLSTQILHNPKT